MVPNAGTGSPDEKAVPATAVEAPTSAESVTSREVVSDTEQNQDENKSKLPFSKARCIALVATVTGASFMNVGRFPASSSPVHPNHSPRDTDVGIDARNPSRGHYPANHRARIEHSRV